MPTRACSILPLCLLVFSALIHAQSPSGDVQRRLTGNWRLVSTENFDEKGVARPGNYASGRIMYDAHGNMAAQLTRDGRRPLSAKPTDAERAEAYSGFLAYYGRYAVDESKGLVTHHVEGSTNPNWVKTTLTRWYAFSPDGNRLMLSLKNDAGRLTATLTWERLR
jgi:Lipocalin-like domain